MTNRREVIHIMKEGNNMNVNIKVRRFFRLVSLVLTLTAVFVLFGKSTGISASAVTVTARDKDELVDALKNKTGGEVVFATNEEITVTIPFVGAAANKTLVINAPKAKIINKAVFASITVKAADTYEEKASGNVINLKGTGVVFRIYKGKSIRKLSVYRKETQIRTGKNAVINELVCANKSSEVILNASSGSIINITNKKSAYVTVTGSPKAKVTINSLPDILSAQPVEQYSIDYWREIKGNDEVLLTTEEINTLNEASKNNGCGIIDLGTDKEYTAESVKAMIEDYSFPSKEYIHERKITEDEKNAILENRNLDGKDFEVRYGIATENGSIRAFPSDAFLTNEKNLYDYLQETGINYGEPLIVLWESSDGDWYFVQAYDYNGWIRKDSVGLCEKETYLDLLQAFSERKIWCPKRDGETEFVTEKGENIKKFLRMGTYITTDGISLLLPERDSKGNLYFSIAKEPAETDGKLMKFTSNNLLSLCEEALGTPYSWGDIDEKGMDCSSTLQSIYRCFGILLPRNSSQQIKTAFNIINLSETDKKEKYEIISGLPLGTILYMPGHVMLYLGMYDGMPYVIQNTTDSARDDGGVIIYNSCVLTSLENGIAGNSLFDRVTYAVSITCSDL